MKDPYRYWNRCDYCGKFIALDDFENGKAERYMYIRQASNNYDPEAYEAYATHHMACQLKYDGNISCGCLMGETK